MDPLTIMLFGLAVLWLIRRGTEDVMSIATGHESPRVTRLRERRAQGRPTVVEALGARIARLIAEGRDRNREPGPLRRYAGELWADSWDDALAGHERRRRRRARRRVAKQQWVPAPHAPDAAGDDSDVVDAELVNEHDTFDDDQPEQFTQPPTPEPAPAQEPLREEPSPMSTPNTATISGDVTSPVKAMKWADGNRDANRAVKEQLVHLAGRVKASGLSPAVLAQVGAVIGAAERFDSGACGARDEYADHVLVQAELVSDTAVRDAVLGYLAASTA